MRRVGVTTVALLRSCHPEPTVAVVLMVTGLAVTTGHTVTGVLLVAAAVLTGQLSIGWLNDTLDAERDKAVGRADKPIAAGAVAVRTVGVATVVAAVLCVPLSFALGLLAGLLHVTAVGAGWAYDLGLKSTPALAAALPRLLRAAAGVRRGGAAGRAAAAVVAARRRCAAGRRCALRERAARSRGRRLHGRARPAAPDRRSGSRVAAAALLLAATAVLGLAAPIPAGPRLGRAGAGRPGAGRRLPRRAAARGRARRSGPCWSWR